MAYKTGFPEEEKKALCQPFTSMRRDQRKKNSDTEMTIRDRNISGGWYDTGLMMQHRNITHFAKFRCDLAAPVLKPELPNGPNLVIVVTYDTGIWDC